MQLQLTLSSAPASQADAGTRWVGNWEVRDFHGYHQSREGGVGPWRFAVTGFCPIVAGLAYCHVLRTDGGKELVPIDSKDRITVRGHKYSRASWAH